MKTKSEISEKILPVENLGLAGFLREKRLAKNVTIERLSDLTKIQIYHLEALENGRFDKLPPMVYRSGIFNRLAKFLDIDKNEITRMCEEENLLESNFDSGKVTTKLNSFRKNIYFILTPQKIAMFFGGLLLVSVSFYLWYQYNFLVGPPTLIFEPKEDIVTKEGSLSLSGVTDSGVDLTVNGENVFVASNGSFAKDIKLADGVNVVEVKAVNNFGKINKIVRQIFKEPQVQSQP